MQAQEALKSHSAPSLSASLANDRGILHALQKQYDRALADFSDALRLARDHDTPLIALHARINAARTALRMDRATTGREWIDQALDQLNRLPPSHDKAVGLMNVGEEEGKGHELVQKSYELLRQGPLRDQFVGNVEGRDIPRGVADVIVTDGFTGNVVLKLSEGVFEFLMNVVRERLVESLQGEKEQAALAPPRVV